MSVTSAPSAMASMALGDFFAAISPGTRPMIWMPSPFRSMSSEKRGTGAASVTRMSTLLTTRSASTTDPRAIPRETARLIGCGALQEHLQTVGIDLRPGEAFGHQQRIHVLDRPPFDGDRRDDATAIAAAPATMNERMVKKSGVRIMG
jgi:hypothetical protein